MSERKNIDKLFQEKFKDFEMDPPENTWPELERRLKKKKDRKVIPFWWRLSGVAAALVIGFLIGNGLGLFDGTNPDQEVNGVVVHDNNANGNPVPSGSVADPNLKLNDATLAPTDSAESTSVAETSGTIQKSGDGNLNRNSGNGANANPNSKVKFNDYQKANPKDAVVGNADAYSEKSPTSSGNNPDQTNIRKKSNQKTNSINNQKTAVAEDLHAKKAAKKRDLKKPDQLTPNPRNAIAGENGLENQNQIANLANDKQATGHKNTTDVPSSEAAIKNNNLSNDTTNPVAAAEEPNQQKKLDSTAIATVQPNALEELLNEKENKVNAAPQLNRWQITSNVAPIYFGSTSGGSPIDSTFANKSKDYNTQVGYGIGVSYAVNKRLTVRTGVNKVSLNYDTNNVELYASLDQGGFGNLDSPSENTFLNFARTVTASRGTTDSRAEASMVATGEIITDKFTGSINQKMGYIEVPVEVSYAVIDKKFGVNVIAGVSTLFLNENEVTLSSGGYQTDLGKANNLNATHFSTNVGLGLRYSFLKSLEAKFEPIFKYQLNTFSKDSGDFKPYFFGLYTGLSFRF